MQLLDENYLTQNIFWYEDIENIYITPDVKDSENIIVNYENDDHSKIIITSDTSYRLSLNLNHSIESIKNISGKQIILKKNKPIYWKQLTKYKNNKVKTSWKNLNIESCFEVEELKIEELDISDKEIFN